MYQKISQYMTKTLQMWGKYDLCYEAVYQYALEKLIANLCNIFLISGISIALGRELETVVFFLGYSLLRYVSGGLHLNSHFTCVCTYLIILLSVMKISEIVTVRFDVSKIIFFCELAAIGIVYLFAPVDSKNRRFTQKQRAALKTKARRMVICQCMLADLILIIRPQKVSILCIFVMGILAQSITLLPFYRFEKRKVRL